MAPPTLAIFLGLLSLLPPGVEKKSSAPTSEVPYVYLRSNPAPVCLRGDWEAPAAVVVAYQPAWPETLGGILDAATSRVPVLMVLKGDSSPQAARIWLDAHGFSTDQVTIIEAALDTVWVRDGGPFQRVDRATGEVRWLDARYGTRPNDDLLPQVLGAYTAVPIDPFPVDIDGGAVISNGRGMCVATEESMLETGVDVEDVGQRDFFLGALGCDALVEVPALAVDPTRHVDMLAQFVAPDAIMLASFDPVLAPEDASRMDEAAERLADGARHSGIPLHIFRVPVAPPVDGVYFSSINGLRLPDAFIVPSFGAISEEFQQDTFRALKAAMPGVTLLRVDADEPISLNGAIHCLAFGIPDASSASSVHVAANRSPPRTHSAGLVPAHASSSTKP